MTVTVTQNLPEHEGTIVSIVHSYPARSPIVSCYRLVDDSGIPHIIPRATEWSHLMLDAKGIGHFDKKLRKLIKAGINAFERLVHVLQSSHVEPFFSTEEGTCPESGAIRSLSIGKGAFIATADETRGLGRLVFTRLEMQYLNGLCSTQYFRARCAMLQPEVFSGRLQNFEDGIDINTGMCLFSRAVIGAEAVRTANAKESISIPEVPRDVALTMYEAEMLIRLATAVADTVGLLRYCNGHQKVRIRVNLDIPDFQYYWTAADIYSEGSAPASYVWQWITAIDQRRQALLQVLRQCIEALLETRELDGVEIYSTPGTDSAVALFKRKLLRDCLPTLGDLLEELPKVGVDGKRWEAFLHGLNDHQQPHCIHDLCQLMYIFKAVRPAFESFDSQLGTQRRSSLIIQLDDLNEGKIFERAKTVLERFDSQRPPIIGINPMERIISGCSTRSSFYLDDPGQYLCSEGDAGRLFPIDVVGATYGAHMWHLLKDACASQGLETGSSWSNSTDDNS